MVYFLLKHSLTQNVHSFREYNIVIRQLHKLRLGEWSALDKTVREALFEKATFEASPEGQEVSHAKSWRGNGKCKGPEAGASLACWRIRVLGALGGWVMQKSAGPEPGLWVTSWVSWRVLNRGLQ